MKFRTSRQFFSRLARRRAARLLAAVAGLPLLLCSAKAANVENDYTGANGGSLLTASNWSLGTVPTVTNDAVLPAGLASGSRSITTGSLTVGSFNSLSISNVLTIQTNTSTSTGSTLTLGGAGNLGNGVSGTSADLFYVASGGTLNILGPSGGTTPGTGTLGLNLGQSGNFNVVGTSSISSIISGGSFGFAKTGAGTLTLSAANTYTGTTAVNRGTLALDFAGTTPPAVTVNDNIISTSSILSLGGGTLSLTGKASTTNSQTFASTTLNIGSSNVSATIGTGGIVNLALGGLTRNTGSAVNFTLPANGSITTPTANTAGAILGGWATVGSSGWAVSAGNGTTAGGISALSSYYTTTTGASTAGNYTGQNVDVTSNVNASGTGVLSGVVTFNSLRFNASTAYTFQFASGTTNTISSGGILFGSGNSSATASTLTGGTITSGTSDLVITSYATTTPSIFSSINGNISLTKAGTGGASIASTLSFTGNIYVNSGSLTLGGTVNVGGNLFVNPGGVLTINNSVTNPYTGQNIVATGGQLILNSSSVAGSLGASGTGSETVVQNGGFFRTSDANLAIAEPFIISGAGQGGNNAGAVQAYNNSPTFSGTVRLAGSSVLSIRPNTANKVVTFSNVISDQTTGANNDLALLRVNNIAATTTDRIVLSGQSTYGGNTYITDAVATTSTTLFNINLQGGDNRLPTTTVVILGGVTPSIGGTGGSVGVATGAGRLELGTGSVAVNQTIAGLTTASSSPLNAVIGGASAVSTLALNNTASYTFGGLLGGTATNNNLLALAKSGAGVLTLTSANTYTGGTTVSAGELYSQSTTNVPLSTGPVTVTGGNVTIGDHAGSVPNYTNNFTLNGAGTSISANTTSGTVGAGALGFFNSGGFSLTGTFNLASNSVIYDNPVTQAGALTFSGVISGAGSLTLAGGSSSTGTPYFLLSNANTYGTTTPATLLTNSGTTQAIVELSTNTNVLPASTVLTFGGTPTGQGGTYNGPVTLRLDGISQTVAGLATSGSGTFAIVGNSGTFSTFAVNNTADYSFGGLLGGAGTNNNNLILTKSGSGSLSLSGANSYNGSTNANGGTLIIAGAQTGTGQLIVSNAAVLQFGNNLSTAGSSDNSSTVFVNNTGTVQIAKTDGGTFTNQIASNPGAVTTLSGINMTGTTNTFSGVEYSNGGSFVINSANAGATLAFSGAGPGAIDLQGTDLTVGGAGNTLFTGAGSGVYSSSGTSNVTKNGTGTLIYQGSQGYSGQTRINAGAVRVDAAQTSNGTYFVGDGTNVGTAASLLLGGGADGTAGGVSFNRAVSVNPGNGTSRTLGGTNTGGTNTFSGNVALDGAFGENRSANLLAAAGGTVVFSGIVSGAGQNVTKTGAGTVTLSGVNTFSGTTTVSAGTLTAAATTGAALGGTTGVAVNAGTLLLGQANQINTAAPLSLGVAATSTGNLSFSAGASQGAASTVSAGVPDGTTTAQGLGALTLNNTATLSFGGAATTLVFNTFTPNGNVLTIGGYSNATFNASAPTSGGAGDDRLVFFGSQTGNFGSFDFGSGPGVGIGQVALDGGFYEVGITPVPEPATWLGGALLLGVAGWGLRRRMTRRTA